MGMMREPWLKSHKIGKSAWQQLPLRSWAVFHCLGTCLLMKLQVQVIPLNGYLEHCCLAHDGIRLALSDFLHQKVLIPRIISDAHILHEHLPLWLLLPPYKPIKEVKFILGIYHSQRSLPFVGANANDEEDAKFGRTRHKVGHTRHK